MRSTCFTKTGFLLPVLATGNHRTPDITLVVHGRPLLAVKVSAWL